MIEASIKKNWPCWTDLELFERWFYAKPWYVTNDCFKLPPGGEFAWMMNRGDCDRCRLPWLPQHRLLDQPRFDSQNCAFLDSADGSLHGPVVGSEDPLVVAYHRHERALAADILTRSRNRFVLGQQVD